MHFRPPHRRRVRWALLLVLLSPVVACSDDSPSAAPSPTLAPHQAATYEYIVPAGTSERIDAGEEIELMPQTLYVKVGESIFIENQDERDYDVGPFFVAAGQSLAMRFTRATVLSGTCEFNPSGQFEIIVQE